MKKDNEYGQLVMVGAITGRFIEIRYQKTVHRPLEKSVIGVENGVGKLKNVT